MPVVSSSSSRSLTEARVPLLAPEGRSLVTEVESITPTAAEELASNRQDQSSYVKLTLTKAALMCMMPKRTISTCPLPSSGHEAGGEDEIRIADARAAGTRSLCCSAGNLIVMSYFIEHEDWI